MTFVMNERGSTKVVGRSKWGKYVRVLSEECPGRDMMMVGPGAVEAKRRSLETLERLVRGLEVEDDEVEEESEDVPRNVVVSMGVDCLGNDDDDDDDDLFHKN